MDRDTQFRDEVELKLYTVKAPAVRLDAGSEPQPDAAMSIDSRACWGSIDGTIFFGKYVV
jgi:hypothetical protein